MNQTAQKLEIQPADEAGLAPYATHASRSRGRLMAEKPSATRTAFQRDRDRIIHCGAFRKLRNKTQVFIENEGDYYRTRLTHSLEVAQIARSVARNLRVNEDLAEAVALSHDLGHTCFGHAGEDALAAVMKPYGGFSHNDQTFRILTQLERHYIQFDGLNLSWETLEGACKHNGPLLPEKAGKPLPTTIKAYAAQNDLMLSSYAGLEAQIAAIADDIAYNTHDIDDGYRAGFFRFDDIAELPLFGPALHDVRKAHPSADPDRIMHEVVRQVIGAMVLDLIATTQANLAELKPRDVQDIRMASKPMAHFSEAMQANEKTLRAFLWNRMYRHSKVNRACARAEKIVQDLFNFFMASPNCLPNSWYEQVKPQENDPTAKARMIADYIAGMTDRFAVLEHRKLFSTEPMI